MHERILDFTETLFERDGLDVGFNRIAGDLGIGVGTVYRHFPDRDALLWAVYERYVARMESGGERILSCEPGMDRIVAFLDATIAFSLRWPLTRSLKTRVQLAFPERIVSLSWSGEIVASVELAKQRGEVRRDTDAGDVAVLAGMVADLANAPEPQRSVMLPRMRAYVLDAIRPENESRPALPSTPLTDEDVTAVVHKWAA